MGNVMNLLKIFSLIVSSSPFIVKLYEFKPKLFQNIVLNFFIISFLNYQKDDRVKVLSSSKKSLERHLK